MERPHKLLHFLVGSKIQVGSCTIDEFWNKASACDEDEFAASTTWRMLNAQELGIFKKLGLPDFEGPNCFEDKPFAQNYAMEEADRAQEYKDDVERAKRGGETLYFDLKTPPQRKQWKIKKEEEEPPSKRMRPARLLLSMQPL